MRDETMRNEGAGRWGRRWASVLALGLALWLGCGSALMTPESVLEEHIETFHQHLRWGRFEECAAYMVEEERTRFLEEFDRKGEDFQITDVEVRRIEMLDAPRRAIVTMSYQAFALPSTVVERERWRQTWEYDNTSRMWRMMEREKLP